MKADNHRQAGQAGADGPFHGLHDHDLRHQLVGEVHTRPFLLIDTPARILHFAFLTGEKEAERDRARIGDLCRSHGLEPPLHARFLALDLGKVRLRWEQHTEFTTYTFDTGVGAATPFRHTDFADVLPGFSLVPPGPLLVAVHVALIRMGKGASRATRLFDPAALNLSRIDDGAALIATDFSADAAGATRILIEDRDLGPSRAGALVQRLLEVETYRLFALLGLPEAQKQGPVVRAIEQDLTDIMAQMRTANGFEDNRKLLDRLTTIASDLEAHSAASSYRFSASRAYSDIVAQRIQIIGEERVAGFRTWAGFLNRRMGPAMQTCRSVETRQADLSRKLERAANLLRTRVDIELEQQNRDLLQSMNRRAQLQLRLQQTVEGLSVAAVSYYVVGLIGYLAKGAKVVGLALPAGLVEAVALPFVVLAIWLLVRRIRKAHAASEPGEKT